MILITLPGKPPIKRAAHPVSLWKGKRGAGEFLGARMHDNPKSAMDTAKVQAFAAQEMQRLGLRPLEGPVILEVTVYRAIPKAMAKKDIPRAQGDLVRPITAPDWSNIWYIVENALKGICYRDDAQVVSPGESRKRYDDGKGERTEITVREWLPAGRYSLEFTTTDETGPCEALDDIGRIDG